MRTWMVDLTGLVIGFALGGAGLLHFWPQIEQLRQSAPAVFPSAGAPGAPSGAAAGPAAPAQAAAQAPGSAPGTTYGPVRRLPLVVTPEPGALPEPPTAMLLPPPADLPQVVTPDEPDPAEPARLPGHGIAGTGFFVADNLVMTAAHVVNGCRRAEIMSPFIRPTRVQIEARDTNHDIALLDAPDVKAPATLAIGRPTDGGERVFILGYPATAGPLVPQATWGVLENDKLPPQPAALTDPRDQIWMHADAVTHGYSGGPIFDPQSGKVVGIVRASLDGSRLSGIRGMPTSGMSVGPGSALLDTFLADEAPGTDAFPADQWGDNPLTVVRRATVHVVCWF